MVSLHGSDLALMSVTLLQVRWPTSGDYVQNLCFQSRLYILYTIRQILGSRYLSLLSSYSLCPIYTYNVNITSNYIHCPPPHTHTHLKFTLIKVLEVNKKSLETLSFQTTATAHVNLINNK